MSEPKEQPKSRAALGAEYVGAAAGGVVGTVLAGPVGAAAGGLAGVAVTRALTEMAARMLSQREQERVRTVSGLAADRIQSRLSVGDKLRSDGFFEHSKGGDRSDADEVFEGVLLRARDEHEERKLKYLANLMANIAFEGDVDAPFANHMVRIAERCSYTQICILVVVRLRSLATIPLNPDYPSETDTTLTIAHGSLLQETLQLFREGLVFSKHDDGHDLVNSFADIVPDRLTITLLGNWFTGLLFNGADVDDKDLAEIERMLGGTGENVARALETLRPATSPTE